MRRLRRRSPPSSTWPTRSSMERFMQYKAGHAAAQRALARYRKLGDPLGTALAQRLAGAALVFLVRIPEGEALLAEPLSAARTQGARKLAPGCCKASPARVCAPATLPEQGRVMARHWRAPRRAVTTWGRRWSRAISPRRSSAGAMRGGAPARRRGACRRSRSLRYAWHCDIALQHGGVSYRAGPLRRGAHARPRSARAPSRCAVRGTSGRHVAASGRRRSVTSGRARRGR